MITLLVKYKNVLKLILKLYKVKLFYNIINRNLFIKFHKIFRKIIFKFAKNLITTNVRF